MKPAPVLVLLPPDRAKVLPSRPRKSVQRETAAQRRAQLSITFERLSITASGPELACLDLMLAALAKGGE